MVTTDTKIFDILSSEFCRDAGWYMVDNPSRLVLGISMGADMDEVKIVGAAPYLWSPLEKELEIIELVVAGREKYPVKVSSDQMVAVAVPENFRKILWKRADEISMNDHVIVPVRVSGYWVLSSAPVKSKKKISINSSKWGMPLVVALSLEGNSRSYCAIGGLLYV